MIFTSDKDYKATKKIKRGTSKIKKEFVPLALWIDNNYNVKTLNIFFDYINKNKSKPRLQICLEFAKDKGKFMDNRAFKFDEIKQKEITNKFQETILKYKSKDNLNWIKEQLGITYKHKNLFVYFTDFESIAKIEANENIPEKEIIKLKSELNNQEIWEIVRRFSGVTYFLYTDKQLNKYRKTNTHNEWINKYFNLLKKYDEFNYFQKEYFSIYLDSKENLDTNYESNWYYYYK